MVKNVGKSHRLMLIFVFLTLLARSFTGTPNAQANFMGLIFNQISSNESAQAPLLSQTGEQKAISDHKGASKAPAKSAEYKLYKKYVQPDKSFSITQNFRFRWMD